MERSDLSLLTESYEAVKFQNYVNELFLEGKSEQEIVDILTEAGLWDRMKSRWGAYSPFEKENRERMATSLKGSAARLGKKGLEKIGDVTDTDMAGGGMYQKLHAADEAGRSAESQSRGKTYSALVNKHAHDIESILEDSIQQRKVIMDQLNDIIDQIVDDYAKIGGVSNTSALKHQLRTTVENLYFRLGTMNDAGHNTDIMVNNIIEHINKQKVHGAGGAGLRKADKLPPRY